MIRFNRLIEAIKTSLANVRRAIAGEIVMTPQLEEVNMSLIVGRVPAVWASKSYPSLKPLGSYVTDFLLRLNIYISLKFIHQHKTPVNKLIFFYPRLKFLQNWIDNGVPTVFWLSGFYFTQSFLTGVLQNFSRANKVPIDKVGFTFEVTDFEAHVQVDNNPPFGVYTKVNIFFFIN